MSLLIIVLLALAAATLGLRTTAVLLGPRVHPWLRLAVAFAAGWLFVAVILELSRSYRVYELGLGLLLALSPVGVFDLVKWWFRRRAGGHLK
jgi:high-affinity Fe2+/Pb2+ permease